MEKRTGGDAMKARSHDVTELPPKLKDIGIGKMESVRWQKIAAIPENKFEEYLADAAGRTRPAMPQRTNNCRVPWKR